MNYTDIAASPDDIAGLFFSFWLDARTIEGEFAEATGELGARRPIVSLRLSASADSVSFVLPNGTDSSRFVGRIDCDSLWGTFWAFASSAGANVTFKRVIGDSVLRDSLPGA